MKWLFLLLLLLNLGLFIWLYPQDSEPDAAPPPAPPGVRTLTLLTEVPEEMRESMRADDRAVAIETEPSAQLTADRQAVADKIAPPAEQRILDTAPRSRVADGDASAATTTLQGFERDIDRQRSAASALAADDASRMPDAVDVEPQTLPTDLCLRLGPLEKREQADKLSLRLRAMGMETALQTETSNDQEGYWVLIPPQQSRGEAVEIVERLRAAGVSDLWRFTSGSLAHAVSLGLFRHESRAQIRREDIVERGFEEAEVRPRYRQRNRYWLDVRFGGETPLAEASWKEIVEDHPAIERIEQECR